MKQMIGLQSQVTSRISSAPLFQGGVFMREGGQTPHPKLSMVLRQPGSIARAERKNYVLEAGTMIFLSKARFLQSLGDPHPNPPKQTPGTGHVMQLKYLSWHERPIVPWWAVLDLSLQRKLNSLGKISDMVKLYSSWHFSHAVYFIPAYLCGWRKDQRKL